MKTTPVTDNLTQLTRLHLVNAFLVREDDGFTLVDTTLGRGAGALIAAARAAGAPIRRIALTHGHPQTSTAGCTGDISVPIDEAHVGAANISAVFVATYSDNPGGGEPPQQGSAEVRLVPGATG